MLLLFIFNFSKFRILLYAAIPAVEVLSGLGHVRRQPPAGPGRIFRVLGYQMPVAYLF